MGRSNQGLDAVEMMRSIRDRISAEIEGMTLEEELVWFAAREMKDPYLRRLRERVTGPTSSGGPSSPK